jgi:hypothetical protein
LCFRFADRIVRVLEQTEAFAASVEELRSQAHIEVRCNQAIVALVGTAWKCRDAIRDPVRNRELDCLVPCVRRGIPRGPGRLIANSLATWVLDGANEICTKSPGQYDCKLLI